MGHIDRNGSLADLLHSDLSRGDRSAKSTLPSA
jgi:hypothetical protein